VAELVELVVYTDLRLPAEPVARVVPEGEGEVAVRAGQGATAENAKAALEPPDEAYLAEVVGKVGIGRRQLQGVGVVEEREVLAVLAELVGMDMVGAGEEPKGGTQAGTLTIMVAVLAQKDTIRLTLQPLPVTRADQ
jgi:hypothetical protein